MPYRNGCSLAGLILTPTNVRSNKSLSKFAALYPFAEILANHPTRFPADEIANFLQGHLIIIFVTGL